ncbi:MAG: hypothetical protein J6X11_14725 [Treponema sp.]|nr:hypothetical protein [Treponema sp.]
MKKEFRKPDYPSKPDYRHPLTPKYCKYCGRRLTEDGECPENCLENGPYPIKIKTIGKEY